MEKIDVFKTRYDLKLTKNTEEAINNFKHRELYFRPGNIDLSDTGHRLLVGKMAHLISKMAKAGADESELMRAILYSMIVIDAKKYSLDYKKAEFDFDIKDLCKKYGR